MINAVLVTGAAKRMGQHIALHLAQSGWDVVVHYGTSEYEALQTVNQIKSLGRQAIALQADLSDALACQQLVDVAYQEMPHLNALINNASLFEFDRGSDATAQSWQSHMNINARAPWLLTQRLNDLLPSTAKACVINILDQKLFNLNPDYFSYTVSKMTLNGLTDLMAREFAPKIRVCAVAPGLSLVSGEQTEDNFNQSHRMTALGKSSTPDDVAKAIAFLLKSPAITGCTLIVDGGQHLVPLSRDVMFTV